MQSLQNHDLVHSYAKHKGSSFGKGFESELSGYVEHYGESAYAKLNEHLLSNLSNIRKRLGGERYSEAIALFTNANKQLVNTNSAQSYDDCIEFLLTNYYDPMYDHQLKQKTSSILFKGTHEMILEWHNQ